jgi:hypothetical protein
LPAGKVYWMQPGWVRVTGETRWAPATVYRPSSEPVERRPAALVARFRPGASRTLALTVGNTLRVTTDDEGLVGAVKTRAVFREQVAAAPGGGARLTLRYLQADREEFEGPRPRPSALLGQVRPFLGRLVTVVQVDAAGNPTGGSVRAPNLAGIPKETAENLLRFHTPIRLSLEALAVPLPNKEVAPGEQWQADRPLPMPTPTGAAGQMHLGYTYLGRRGRDGGAEAVLALAGTVREEAGPGGRLGGTARGTAVVDLATGQVRLAEVRVSADLEVALPVPDDEAPRRIRALNTLQVRLERGR